MNAKDLFHPFVATDAKKNWEAYTSPRMEYFCDDIPGVDFSAGFLVAVKPTFMDIPHIHDGADNCFIFTGPDLDRMFEADFEVDIFLGDAPDSMEVYRITKPSFVRVPAGVWHCPVYYRKVGRGVNTILWYSGQSSGRVYPSPSDPKTFIYEKDVFTARPCVKDASKPCTFCGACFNYTDEQVKAFVTPLYEKAAKTQKYKDCIVELRQDHHSLGDAVISPRAAFKGPEEMAGAQRQFSFNIVAKPCRLGDDRPVSNGQAVEFLWFSGADAVDPWNSFDAEIVVEIGESPDRMEKIVVDRPGVVAVPPGVWRGAVEVRRVGKPLCFIPWYQHDKARYRLTRQYIDGKPVLVYDDESTIDSPTSGDELYMQIKR